MYLYEQRTGRLIHDGALIGTGYSGFGPHRNKPESEALVGLGPIPCGAYWIGAEYDSRERGPVVLPLLPIVPPPEILKALPGAMGTNTHGRSAFLVHGDAREHPGEASHGCIIQSRPVRELVADGRDRLLIVVAGPEGVA